MDIKVGDIVRFEGRDVRVLRVASSILLSYFGPVRGSLANLELIESYDPPKFEVDVERILHPNDIRVELARRAIESLGFRCMRSQHHENAQKPCR